MKQFQSWRLKPADEEKVERLEQQLRIHPILCRILVQRGIEDLETAQRYFRPQLDHLHDPWLMKDMDKAVARVMQAIQAGEKILVFGDYDVDGTAAVACMYQFIRKQHQLTGFYIPNRQREGYGISKTGIDFAHENDYTLIIALDCGIKSVELISYAKTLGIGFIICDHHFNGGELPDAVAILNPKQPGCNYPFKELCGCGIGYKLIAALTQKMGLPDEEALEYLDLVAAATAADIVPMTGENRTLCYFGLRKANENPNPGIQALKDLSETQKELQINSLVFMIAPRVNAAGRMDEGKKAVQLFIADNYHEAYHWARQLEADNMSRKITDSHTTEEALDIIEGDKELMNRKSTVLYRPHWHKGIVGIVASRLIDSYHRPTVVLGQSNGLVTGSARSIPGFNIYEAIHQCRELLIGYGGHFYAAGMTLAREQVDAFCEKFEEVVSASIDPDLLKPELIYDAELTFKDITTKFFKLLCQMGPFGPENMRPAFLARRVYNTGYSKLVKGEHIRFHLRQNNTNITGIGFFMPEKMQLVRSKDAMDIVFKIEESDFNPGRPLQ
ncbi:MAG TPA: single-stranded-DNA-specific exonuclease RecJ, partial [Chitinophaga sp.]|nr:single-stranded-DNA-specific exonuclease RecJ [Chitinophaga sp.]